MFMTEEQKTALYKDYSRKVLGYLYNKINNYHQAEDLASNVWMKVFEKLETFDETKASVSTWIFTITRNTLNDWFRTRKVMNDIPETMEDDSSVEEEVCNTETLASLTEGLKHLDERERDIIILRFYSGKTLKEIAENMGISYAYVKILQNKAMATLRSYIGGDDDDE